MSAAVRSTTSTQLSWGASELCSDCRLRSHTFITLDCASVEGVPMPPRTGGLPTTSILYWPLAVRGVKEGDDRPEDGKGPGRGSAVLFLRDAAIAFAIVVCILVGMYAYTGLWPPLVVVESNSMQHDDDRSYIGVIDTGDLVLVKKVDKGGEVDTYVDGVASGHRTYGDYGDVIIYKKFGSDSYTPIIHRAIIYLQANSDGQSYSAPSLRLIPADMWSVTNDEDTWLRLTSSLTIRDVGAYQDPFYRAVDVTISISSIIDLYRGEGLPSGFITMGDHNFATDQQSMHGVGTRLVETDWVVGKARGEIPWFGLLKLWFTDSLGSEAPDNSIRNLWISIAVIVLLPVTVDVVLTYREKRRIAAGHTKEVEDQPEEGSRRDEPPPPETD
jgi:signal peptidase